MCHLIRNINIFEISSYYRSSAHPQEFRLLTRVHQTFVTGESIIGEILEAPFVMCVLHYLDSVWYYRMRE
jgi:hypothetical protein